MNYWEDMQTKGGFSDGDAVPVGADRYRAAYVLAVNALAARLNSCVRAFAWDRPGMHNSCLVCFSSEAEVLAADPLSLSEHRGAPGAGFHDEEIDEAMRDAIQIASTLGIDGYVVTRVTLAKASIKALLKEMSAADLSTEVLCG